MTTTLTAPDITCGGCANAIRRALGTLPGVSEVTVEVDRKTVVVTHQGGVTDHDALVAALDRAGFPAEDAPAAEPATSCSCCKP